MENLVDPDLFIHCGKPLLALNLLVVENLLLGPHLFSLTTDVHNIKVSPNKQVSTSSSSGSSIVRMVQDSPDSVLPGSSASSSSGYSHVAGTPSCTLQEDIGLPVKVDQVQTSQNVSSTRFTQETYSNIARIQSVPGYTERINANVQVNMLQIHWLQYFTLYLKL